MSIPRSFFGIAGQVPTRSTDDEPAVAADLAGDFGQWHRAVNPPVLAASAGQTAELGSLSRIMFTIFHLLQVLGVVAGLVVGAGVGGGRFGLAGAIAGGALGLVIGWFVGRLPWLLAWGALRRDLRRASAEELRQRVSREYYISHLLIAELASRGESIDVLREVVKEQLRSESPDRRRFAEATAKLWFPDLLGAG